MKKNRRKILLSILLNLIFFANQNVQGSNEGFDSALLKSCVKEPTDIELIPAYGDQTLVNNHLPITEFLDISNKTHRAIILDDAAFANISCLISGIYSPLSGFMKKNDYRSVVEHMCLQNNTHWPIPIILPINMDKSNSMEIGSNVNLVYHNQTVAIMTIEDIFPRQIEKEALSVYGTIDENHPGVQAILSQSTVCVGGKVMGNIDLIKSLSPFQQYLKFPHETRALFRQKGWQSVAAFQTRNPLHRSHEHLLKVALHITDGILLNPLVGTTKNDDVPAEVRVKTYEATIENYFPKGSIELVTYPAAMRYAGPKEAILHAITRQNYGCTHFIVGRDHAGVGNFYDPLAAQRIFTERPNPDLKIQILKFDNAFYCITTQEMGNKKTCPEGSDIIQLSGTEIRRRLKAGESIPAEMTRPEVVEILRQHYTKGE